MLLLKIGRANATRIVRYAAAIDNCEQFKWLHTRKKRLFSEGNCDLKPIRILRLSVQVHSTKLTKSFYDQSHTVKISSEIRKETILEPIYVRLHTNSR